MCPWIRTPLLALAVWAAPLVNLLAEESAALGAPIHPVREKADLDPLIEELADRRVVLLGEATHGTSEFYTWRAKISQRLIEEKGFSFIAVEGDWAALERVNRWINAPEAGDDAVPIREILEDFDRWPSWLWANEEVVELAEWLREYNRDRPAEDRVGFHGIDVYGWEESLDALLVLLEEASEDLYNELNALYRDFARYRGDPQRYARAAFAFASSAEEDVPKALARLRGNRDTLVQALGEEGYFQAEQYALVIRNAEAHIRKMAEDQAASWNARAGHFKKTVARLLEHRREDARAIVWAHNTHVGDARATPMAEQGQVNIGLLARERWGDAVFILGFSTHRGEVVAGRAWDSDPEVMPIPPARAGSLDDLLYRTGHPQALILFDAVAEDSPLLHPLGHRAIGVVYQPEHEAANYVPTRAPDRYDGLMFIKETRPLSLLD